MTISLILPLKKDYLSLDNTWIVVYSNNCLNLPSLSSCGSKIISFFNTFFTCNANIDRHALIIPQLKNYLCYGYHTEPNYTLYHPYNWEFVHKLTNYSPLPNTINHTLYLFIIVFSISFLSSIIGGMVFRPLDVLWPIFMYHSKLFIKNTMSTIESIVFTPLYKFAAIFMSNSKLSIDKSLSVRSSADNLYWGKISLSHFYIFASLLFALLYLITGFFFDYILHSIYVRKSINLNSLKHLLIGLLYYLNIVLGIFFTNSFWYIAHKYYVHNLDAALIGCVLTMLFSSLWYKFRSTGKIPNYDIINSIFRSILETATFISICFSTYGSWNLYISLTRYSLANFLAIALGLLVHIIFGYFLIGIELNSGSLFLYGPLYFIWWSAAIFNTNALITIFTVRFPYEQYISYWFITIFITFLSVLINYPNYYLNHASSVLNTPDRTNLLNRIFNFINTNRYVIVSRLYICILSYCISVGLIWSLILSYFT